MNHEDQDAYLQQMVQGSSCVRAAAATVAQTLNVRGGEEAGAVVRRCIALAGAAAADGDAATAARLCELGRAVCDGVLRSDKSDGHGQLWAGISLGEYVARAAPPLKEKIGFAHELRDYFSAALDALPESALAHYSMGMWCLRTVEHTPGAVGGLFLDLFVGRQPPQSSLEEAMRHLRRAAELDPELHRNNMVLATKLYEQKSYEEALAAAERVVAAGPSAAKGVDVADAEKLRDACERKLRGGQRRR